jgi:hypothetical protein
MSEKVKFEQEHLFKTSPKVLNNMIMSPSGLSEWFADDVIIKDDIYTFYWDGSEESARLLSKKVNSHLKLRWLEDEEDELDTYLELRFEVDQMTKTVILHLTAFADDDELEESQLYWENTIGELKRVLGA